jgi:hypothetical protein
MRFLTHVIGHKISVEQFAGNNLETLQQTVPHHAKRMGTVQHASNVISADSPLLTGQDQQLYVEQ